jgi:hypothetical protein
MRGDVGRQQLERRLLYYSVLDLHPLTQFAPPKLKGVHFYQNKRSLPQKNGNFDRKLPFFFFAKKAHGSGFFCDNGKKSKAQGSISVAIFSTK